MAFSSASVSVTNAATSLVNPTTGSKGDPVPVIVFNNDPTVTVFLGGATVTAAQGTPLLAQTGVTVQLIAGEQIFAITAAATVDVRVMRGRQ
jgi:hypothetical protein